MMTRYTMGFLALGIAASVLLTPARRYLRTPWLWGGVAAALLIFLPNFAWQVRHNFISLDFLRYLHARDVRIGRTDGFLWSQIWVPANPVTVPLSAAGLWFYFATPSGRRYRMLGWMFAIPFVLFMIARGREYYTSGSYLMLFVGGAAVKRVLDRVFEASPRCARIGLERIGVRRSIGRNGGAFRLLVNSWWWNRWP